MSRTNNPQISDPREFLSEPEKAAAVRDHLNRALEADGFAITVVSGKAHLVDHQSTGMIVEPFITKVRTLDFDTVQIEIARALPNVTADPEDAVMAACSLIEAVCKPRAQITNARQKNVDGLIRAIQEPLGLSPCRTDLPADIERGVRQILGGFTSVVKGIGDLRTHGVTRKAVIVARLGSIPASPVL
ncbi:abortive infection family protein [Rhizobium leguminosarum]|uniref:abortive infection family protein n=1 Tax=Rhizobium leguminosarum TaxID=384 RepID=UPI001C972FFE|nr:abortive infection family protein [Rhizobium leguminosarum]